MADLLNDLLCLLLLGSFSRVTISYRHARYTRWLVQSDIARARLTASQIGLLLHIVRLDVTSRGGVIGEFRVERSRWSLPLRGLSSDTYRSGRFCGYYSPAGDVAANLRLIRYIVLLCALLFMPFG